jgi:uncharacterized protein YjiS (DUF1127 family)
MAYSTTITTDAGVAGASSGLFGRVRKLVAGYGRYRSTIAELNRLSERELADIGLAQDRIHSIARESAFGAN